MSVCGQHHKLLLSDWWSVHMRPWKGSKRWRRKFGCCLLPSLSRIYYMSLYNAFYHILLLDMRMNNYKIYNPVFITCMFWFIRLIYLHCLYMSARLGGLMLRTSVLFKIRIWREAEHAVFSLIMLQSAYTNDCSLCHSVGPHWTERVTTDGFS